MPTSHNNRVSGSVPSALRPNPRPSARTSDTRQPLCEIIDEMYNGALGTDKSKNGFGIKTI